MTKVIIIGAGPSALFAAKTILETSHAISVEILEQGKTQAERFCAADEAKCKRCLHCATLEGVGGAGLFSDGKLVLDLTSGGKADGIGKLTTPERHSLEEDIKETFLKFDGTSEIKDKPSDEIQTSLRSDFRERNLEFKFYNVMHMGTKNFQNITTNFIDYLKTHFEKRFEIKTDTRVADIKKNDFGYSVVTNNGTVQAEAVIAAVGKSGFHWLKKVLSPMGCNFTTNDFFFGFRMETQIENIKDLVEFSLDPKIYRYDSDRKIKIHCFCRNGKIRYSRYRDVVVVGGHSPYTKKNNINDDLMSANFNILLSFNKNLFCSDDLLDKFREENKDIVMVQKLSDFIEGRTSENFGIIRPSNLAMVRFGNLRRLMDSIDSEFSEIVIRFLRSIAELYPGVMDDDNMLYAPAIEWDMDTVKVDQHMETEQKNLFAIGDGAGLSQGIVYSAATGIIAAEEIIARFEDGNV
jgi:uncharacterized FAD-dependent dehydrogenase